MLLSQMPNSDFTIFDNKPNLKPTEHNANPAKTSKPQLFITSKMVFDDSASPYSTTNATHRKLNHERRVTRTEKANLSNNSNINSLMSSLHIMNNNAQPLVNSARVSRERTMNNVMIFDPNELSTKHKKKQVRIIAQSIS